MPLNNADISHWVLKLAVIKGSYCKKHFVFFPLLLPRCFLHYTGFSKFHRIDYTNTGGHFIFNEVESWSGVEWSGVTDSTDSLCYCYLPTLSLPLYLRLKKVMKGWGTIFFLL